MYRQERHSRAFLAVILLIVAVFSMKTRTPDVPESLTFSANAAITSDVDHGDAFIRPEPIATAVVSRLAEDLAEPRIQLDESESGYGLAAERRRPAAYNPAGVRRALLRVYRI